VIHLILSVHEFHICELTYLLKFIHMFQINACHKCLSCFCGYPMKHRAAEDMGSLMHKMHLFSLIFEYILCHIFGTFVSGLAE
jgi:hypothetical protein